MWQNYLKIALRNLLRNRVFSIINISGLALGITAFVFILQYVSFEYSYNSFHQNLPNLYRVLTEADIDSKRVTYPFQAPGYAPIMQDQFKEIKAYCRITGGMASGVVTAEKPNSQGISSFRQERICYVDGNFFEIFSFKILKGKGSELKKPFTVAISETESRKYFANENPIGKNLTLHNQFGKAAFAVVAVYADLPQNSDIQRDMLFSFQTLSNASYVGTNNWAKIDNVDSNYLNIILLLQPGADIKAIEQKINAYKKKLRPQNFEKFRLQALKNVHLSASLSDYYDTYGSLALMYSLMAVGVLILAIAWFNYINLSTATALKRAKEVGIRKVIGANRGQLIIQFLGESFLLNMLGVGLALLLIEVFQGMFNWLSDKPLDLTTLGYNGFWLGGLLLLLFGTIASGAYTAFALSRFQPALTLKGAFTTSKSGVWLRKSLVIFQFSISIMLIVSTFILYSQLSYMRNKDLGMNASQMLVIQGAQVGRDSTYSQKAKLFTQKLSQTPFIKAYAASGAVPTRWYNFSTAGITRLNPKEGDDKKSYAFITVDENYLPTYQIKLLAGENFQRSDCNVPWEKVKRVIINRQAALSFGFESAEKAVGQAIKWGENQQLEIIGVSQDYHHESLQNTIQPLIYYPQINDQYYSIRLNAKQMQGKVADLEKLYLETFSGNPFIYFFIDDNFDKSYRTEKQYGAIFTYASGLAIFIACLGLFGLATFTVEARTKEIGIRKVMGASASQIVNLISKDFLRLVIIAFVIASPLAYYLATKWLENFAYRTPIYWWIFGLAGLLAVMIAIVTIGFQALRAGQKNPVESLRYE
ncbi:MAG: ABC transporter permease [Microscillaceae bacterium]|jgi:putative ABC transport system permease protein|nr:ABC transporter permease [Microscillaceae bacterium]